METQTIAKTLLTVWPGLKDYEQMLASRAHTHALGSFASPLGTEQIMEKIIDLNIRQHTIHQLRLGLDQVVAHLDAETQRVIRSNFRIQEADSVRVQVAHLGISERTFFRKLNQGITTVAKKLEQLGINFFTWQDLLHHHRWIRAVYIKTMTPRRQSLARKLPGQTE